MNRIWMSVGSNTGVKKMNTWKSRGTYLVDQFQNLGHDHVQYDEIGQEEVDERDDEKPFAVGAVVGMHMHLQRVHERCPLVPNDANLKERDE